MKTPKIDRPQKPEQYIDKKDQDPKEVQESFEEGLDIDKTPHLRKLTPEKQYPQESSWRAFGQQQRRGFSPENPPHAGSLHDFDSDIPTGNMRSPEDVSKKGYPTEFPAVGQSSEKTPEQTSNPTAPLEARSSRVVGQEKMHNKRISGSSLYDSLSGIRGGVVSSDSLEAVRRNFSSNSIEIQRPSDSTVVSTFDDFLGIEGLKSHERIAFRHLKFYDNVQQNFEQIHFIENSEDAQSNSEIFLFNQLKKKKEESVRKHNQRIFEYMVGRRFKIGNEIFVITQVATKQGGLSHGFIARYESDTISPEKPTRQVFVKCTDLSEYFDSEDQEEMDLMRDSFYKELAYLDLAMQKIPGHVPQIIGIAAFDENSDPQGDIPLQCTTQEHGQAEISSYFFDFQVQDEEFVLADFKIPNKFIVVTEYRGDGTEFTNSIEKHLDTYTTEEITLPTDLALIAKNIISNVYSQEQQKIEEQNLTEIYNYPNSVSKCSFITRFWLSLLQTGQGLDFQQKERINQELERIFNYVEEFKRKRFDELDGVLCDFFSTLDTLNQGGIIHRDIKPGNILVEKLSDGKMNSVLIDFGLAEHEVELLDRDIVIDHTYQAIIHECIQFVEQYDDRYSDYIRQELRMFFEQDETQTPVALVNKIAGLFSFISKKYDWDSHQRLDQKHITSFTKDLYLTLYDGKSTDPDVIQQSEHFSNLMATYAYIQQGKFRLAALNIANPLDYSFKGRTYGTPEFSHPLTYLIASSSFEDERKLVTERIDTMLKTKELLQHSNITIEDIHYEEIAVIIQAIEQRIQQGDELLQDQKTYEKLQEILRQKNTEPNQLSSEDLLPQYIDDILSHYLQRYYRVQSIDKLAALSHRQQDKYSSLLTYYMTFTKLVLQRKEGHPRFMSKALKRASHLWYPAIREIYQSMKNTKSQEFFSEDLNSFLDTDSILVGDLETFVDDIFTTSDHIALYQKQKSVFEQHSGKDILLLNDMLVVLESQTKILYSDCFQYDSNRTHLRERIVKMVHEIQELPEGQERSSCIREYEVLRKQWEQLSQDEEAFYKSNINHFKKVVLQRFESLQKLYSNSH